MPAGERSQTWYPELVTRLRGAWRVELPWEAIIHLRDQLQQNLDDLQSRRHIIRATVRCSRCGAVGPGRPPRISIRAMLLALRRFQIDSEDSVRQLEKSWQKHRALHHLDLYGHPVRDRVEDDHAACENRE